MITNFNLKLTFVIFFYFQFISITWIPHVLVEVAFSFYVIFFSASGRRRLWETSHQAWWINSKRSNAANLYIILKKIKDWNFSRGSDEGIGEKRHNNRGNWKGKRHKSWKRGVQCRHRALGLGCQLANCRFMLIFMVLYVEMGPLVIPCTAIYVYSFIL